MATCPDCGGKMSGLAEMCPHCGFALKHGPVLKQKQRAKRHKEGRSRLLIGCLCLAFGLIMSASGVNLLISLVPFVLSAYFLGYGFLTLIGVVQ